MSAELSDMKALWNRYNETRDYDSLIIATRPFYEKSLAAGDSAAVLYSGVFIAQAYLFSDRIDSARTLLDSVLPYMECTDSPQIRIVVSNVPVVPQRKFFLLDQRCRYLWLFGHLWGRTL